MAPAEHDYGVSWRAAFRLSVALVGTALAALALKGLARPLAILILAITLAEALGPSMRWLARRMPRTIAIFAVYAVLALITALLLWFLVPTIAGEFHQVWVRLPDMLGKLQGRLERWTSALGVSGRLELTDLLRGTGVDSMLAPVVTYAFDLFVVVFLSIYWMLEEAGFRRFVVSLLPSSARRRADRVWMEMADAMGGYLRGAAINGVIMGVVAWIGLRVAGVQFALALGVITALGELVPYIGAIAAGVLATAAGLLESPQKALEVLILYVVLQQAEGHLLTPNIMRSQTQVPAGLVLFAFTAGGMIGGLLGALVAIPLAAAARVAVMRVAVPAARAAQGAE